MPAERPILIVDDDSALRAMLAEQLAENDEFNPVAVASLSEADQSLGAETARFDTVLLDVGLPDGNGHEYCAKLRRQGHKMPIIMLTAPAARRTSSAASRPVRTTISSSRSGCGS